MTGAAPRLVTRIALLHTGLFLASGLLLLAVVDLPLLTADHAGPVSGPVRSSSNLTEVLGYSAVALVVLGLLSVAFGRLTANRALRPLRDLTASARAISASNLPGHLRVDASYREFAELAATLDGLTRRLADAFAAQRHFVANASHELRTPVAAQRTLLEVTLADPDAPAAVLRAACLQALALGEEQEHLITALLTLAHGQRGIDRWEPVDLAEVAAAAVRARADHPLRLHIALAPAVVMGDRRLLASLVTNLVGNAVQHNVPGGTVEVTTAAGRVSVGNTGAVIDPRDLDRLFAPFQRHGTARTGDSAGHGLGLAIVSAVANAHGATLTAHARPHGGLDITVRFPPAAWLGAGGPARSGYHHGMSDDEQYTMGTTATPSTAGADAIDDADTPNGAATGVTNPLGLGGQADPPGLPFDRKPDSTDPVHGVQTATEHGEGGD